MQYREQGDHFEISNTIWFCDGVEYHRGIVICDDLIYDGDSGEYREFIFDTPYESLTWSYASF